MGDGDLYKRSEMFCECRLLMLYCVSWWELDATCNVSIVSSTSYPHSIPRDKL